MIDVQRHSRYGLVFVALVVLTALELSVLRFDDLHLSAVVTFGRAGRVTALVGLAMAKVAAVLFAFMDLRSQSRGLRLAVGVPLVLGPALAIVLLLDAVYRARGGP